MSIEQHVVTVELGYGRVVRISSTGPIDEKLVNSAIEAMNNLSAGRYPDSSHVLPRRPILESPDDSSGNNLL